MPFDDDDVPSAMAAVPSGDDGAANGEDAMEEGMPDYKLFNSLFNKKNVSSKTIRKGEKDFESHGTMAQDNTLEASRQAMEEVLSYTRIHREETWVRGWLFPDACASWPDDEAQEKLSMRDRVVVVEHEKGGWTRDAGRVMPGDRSKAGVGRLWLLPEEALYLVERGTLDLWWPTRTLEELLPPAGLEVERKMPGPDDYDSGLPLSLEAAYSVLVGEEGERGRTTLPKYQVYTHLKRAGFSILRAPSSSHKQEVAASTTSLWQWLLSLMSRETPIKHEPAGPLVKPGLYRAYAPIYRRLAIIPRHKPSPAQPSPSLSGPEEPFRVFYHIWKPSPTPFSKKNPPAPDFRIAVSDTLTSSVPTLDEVTRLLDSTPWDPPPEAMSGKLYQKLKHGYRNVLVAVVDCGLVNFIRFAEGAFGEESLTWRFDVKGGQRGGKKSGGGRGRGGRGRGRGGRGRS